MRPPRQIETLIIGAGLAGLSTALHVDGPRIIVEGESWIGGKARSELIDGFTFDVTGHWLHLRDPTIRSLIFQHLGESHFIHVRRQSRVWSHGVYTRYPFQSNTYGLPPSVVKECVMGAIKAYQERGGRALTTEQEPESFAEWIRAYFGDGIARHFMIPYNAKLWGVDANEITSRWCQRFVPRPQLDDIVAGAVGCNDNDEGYNAQFLYPKFGGIQTVAEGLAGGVGRESIFLNSAVVSVDTDSRCVTLHTGETIHYQRLVNTMALPKFVDLVERCPDTVVNARRALRATDVIYLNVGIEGSLKQSDHWIYVPELEWPMYRVGSFSNANPNMAPDGCSSLYIELSDRMTDPMKLIPRISEGLIAMNLIDDVSQIRFMIPRRIPDAYVLYDRHYGPSRRTIHEWLSELGVQSVGRYGDWNYSSMEDALLDGCRVAAQLAESKV